MGMVEVRNFKFGTNTDHPKPLTQNVQDTQLSRRDRASGFVTVFAKSRRLELGDNILRTLYFYLQPLWYNRPENLSNSVKNAK